MLPLKITELKYLRGDPKSTMLAKAIGILSICETKDFSSWWGITGLFIECKIGWEPFNCMAFMWAVLEYFLYQNGAQIVGNSNGTNVEEVVGLCIHCEFEALKTDHLTSLYLKDYQVVLVKVEMLVLCFLWMSKVFLK